MSRRAQKGGRSAMLLLAGCFTLSAFARGVEPAIAYAVETSDGPVAIDEAPADGATTAADAPGPTHSDLAALLKALRERESQLDAREERIAIKAKVIEAAEERLRDQMTRLEGAEARLSALVHVADGAAERDVGKLVATFETMDEKRAAPIFETMDVAFASGLLSRMEDGAAADILGALSPEKAYAITVQIAGRNARAPKE
ncbi:hypothetical protein G5B40_16895 [Pikeienuella piscinae]|uniref:Magnesium transporter MgtE intracellular domain-containing protein n=1 Tax=Pikeienuella piscinae TaxID=2748098 RepID=A0A7L5C1F8_9RHOB|nr:hypothetical protein [Pikeienuella piscinae]QIE56968.1 hypothetical protein G5B40_16895 [Pikeienuella piscinae]